LKERSVRFTTTAQGHVKREKTWRLENRAYTDVFATEIEEALQILSIFPGVGTLYKEAGLSGLRRLYPRKIDCHLYYTFDEREVIVRALWGARRRRGPRIKP
jgi:hypothetical protein